MNSDIPLQTAAIFFSDKLLCETGYSLGLSWLISFAWASSSCKERKRDLQNEKFFLPTALLELMTFRLRGHRLNRYAAETCTLVVFKLYQVFPVVFKSLRKHVAWCFLVYSVLYSYINICIILRFE